ncbi:AraC family transcriptional regulator [Anaerosporobacter sp.]|uniref:AraC family transcriptional regulator n=1 Tax=Anaerosporobacter sp. TaxID=1872529 RepID=UPI00286EC441|nr:AraC family transcriptional regulator [Anaerosporobacter sp.]
MIYESYGFANIDSFTTNLLHIYDLGIEHRQDEEYDYNNAKRKDYDGYLLQYTLEGRGYIEINKETTELTAGKAFLIPFPHESRYYLGKEEGEEWDFFYIHFNGEIATKYYEYVSKMNGNIVSVSKNSLSIQMLMKEFQAIQNGKQYGQYNNSIALYKFLIMFLQDIETPAHSMNIGCVDKAADWMAQNFSTQKNLSEMCIEIGVSLAHLTRQFHLQKGITPMQYLRNMRLDHSLTLLVSTDLSVEEISGKCGFSNGNYYTKVFRKSFGLTPTAYRMMHRKKMYS